MSQNVNDQQQAPPAAAPAAPPAGITPEINAYFAAMTDSRLAVLQRQLEQEFANLRATVVTDKPTDQEKTVAKLVKDNMRNFTGRDRRPHVLRTFVDNFEKYADLMRLQGSQRGIAISALFEDDAAIWYQSLNQTYAWSEFKDQFIRRFRDPQAEDNARAKLHKLEQRSSAKKYTEEFKRLAACISNLTESDVFQTFKRGLKPSLRHDLTVMKVASFDEAVREAEELDEITFQERSNSKTWRSKNDESVNKVDGHIRDRQSGRDDPDKAAERSELRAKGACFYCKQLGHIAIACPNKQQSKN